MSLTCKAPAFKVQKPLLRFAGQAALPDGVMLKIRVSRLVEDLEAGKVEPRLLHAATGLTEVSGRRFEYVTPADGPGLYRVEVSLVEDFQRKEIWAEIRSRKVARRRWDFELAIWDDELAGALVPKLREVVSLAAEVRAMLDRFDQVTESPTQWQAESKAISRANAALLRKVEKSELHAFYPAAMAQLFYTVRTVQGTASYFHWTEGRFTGGVSYHAKDREMETFRQEKFSWEALKRYVDESLLCAGRELGLWVVKDVRRGGSLRAELAQAIREAKPMPGTAVDGRLETVTVAELEALEAELRGRAK